MSALPPDDDIPAPWAAGQSASPSPAPGQKRSDWREADAGKPGRLPQIAVAGAMFLALVGAIVAWLTYLGRGDVVTLLAIPVSQYKHITWAANPTADSDAIRLLKAFGDDKAAVADQERERFRDRLDGLADRDGRPLVVSISALTAVRNGEVYILPAEAKPDDTTDQWVSMRYVIEKMTACPAAKKGLWLDIARPVAGPFRGPLLDDVADRLDATLKASPPPFPVLCSCSAGEASLTIPQRGASAFAAYLEEGLTGAADGYPSGQLDGKVTFAELAEFVSRRVARWADYTRFASQTPAVYGPAGDDFVLVYRGRPAPPPPPPPVDPAAPPPPPPPDPVYPSALSEGWAKRDAARYGSVRWSAPIVVADLESPLFRAEIPFWTGTPNNPTSNENKVIDSRLTRVPAGPPAATLFDRIAGRPEPPPELAKALADWRKLMVPPPPPMAGTTPPPPRTNELEAAQQEFARLAKGRADDVVKLVWDGLVSDPELSSEKIRAAVTALTAGPFRADPPPATAEWLLVLQLAAVKLPSAAYPEAVVNLLRAEAELSRASAGPRGGMPGGFTRYQSQLTAADRFKRQAEQKFFAAKTDAEIRNAEFELRTAIDQLKSVADAANAVWAGRQTWADAADWLRATLPGMVSVNIPDSRVWREVADAAGPVADWFASGATDFSRLREQTELLRERTAKLTQSFQPAAIKASLVGISKPGPDQAKSLINLTGLLAGAGLTAPDRGMSAAAVAKVWADRERTLWTEYDAKDSLGNSLTQRLDSRPAPMAPADRARRRADAAVTLLRLSGWPGSGQVDAAQKAVNDSPSDPMVWQKLADELRMVWITELPKATAGGGEGVDRVARVYPGGLGWPNASGRPWGLFWEDEAARWDWLTERYREYGKLRAGFPMAREFFAALAGERRPDRGP